MRKIRVLLKLIYFVIFFLLILFIFIKIRYINIRKNRFTNKISSEFNIREYGFENKIKEEYDKNENAERKIINEIKIIENKIDTNSFLNYNLDINFLESICIKLKKKFEKEKINKIIAFKPNSLVIASLLSKYFENSLVVYVKKNMEETILKEYLKKEDNVLIVDNIVEDENYILFLYNILNNLNVNLIGLSLIVENFNENLKSKGIRIEALLETKFINETIKFKVKSKKQKFLVLTASTGNGHNQAANNLKIEIEKNDDECKIVNIFKQINDGNPNLLFEKGYDLLVTKMPKLYHILYKLADKKLIKDIFSNILILPRAELKKIIFEENPDIIISAHPFSVPLIMNEFNKIDLKGPFIQIITDFKPHEMYIDESVDAYITGSEYTKEILIEKGIDKDKIFVYGIPIKKSFLEPKSNYENNEFNLLIMGGSMGLNGIESSTEILLNSNLDFTITVVCGNNEKIKNRLSLKFKEYINKGKLTVLGFVDNINELMEKSKLIITKPGGLTSTEAISKNLPMIIPFCIPGQEQENTDFLVNNNMAMEIDELEKLPDIIKMLMEDRELYEEMVNSMKQLSQNYSIDKIIELAKDLSN